MSPRSRAKRKDDPNLTEREAGAVEALEAVIASLTETSGKRRLHAARRGDGPKQRAAREGLQLRASSLTDAAAEFKQALDKIKDCAASRTVLQRAEG